MKLRLGEVDADGRKGVWGCSSAFEVEWGYFGTIVDNERSALEDDKGSHVDGIGCPILGAQRNFGGQAMGTRNEIQPICWRVGDGTSNLIMCYLIRNANEWLSACSHSKPARPFRCLSHMRRRSVLQGNFRIFLHKPQRPQADTRRRRNDSTGEPSER